MTSLILDFCQSPVVTWSLAVEEQFYLMLPWFILKCPVKLFSKLLIGLIALVPLIRFAVLIGWHNPLACYVLIFTHADCLLMGVLVAYMYRQPQWLIRQSRSKLWIIFYVLAFVVLIISCSCPGIMRSVQMVTFGYLAIALASTCFLILALKSRGTVLEKFLINKTLIATGRISYGLYLLHVPILGLVHGIILKHTPRHDSIESVLVTLFALLITIALASLSWRFFESPLINFAHKLKYEPAATSGYLPM